MTVGARLPDFDLETSGGGRVSSEDLRGRRTVLYFYPKDDTPGCTLEGQEFTRLKSAFDEAGVTVYGISPDTAKKHQRFIEKCGLGIQLISDPDRRLIDSQGLWVEKKFMGRTYMGVARTTLLVGPDGTIEREWRDVKPSGHAAEVLETVNGG
jgi:thioredoxin-dependent peroxiredoxin